MAGSCEHGNELSGSIIFGEAYKLFIYLFRYLITYRVKWWGFVKTEQHNEYRILCKDFAWLLD
jgi:hypothetical protein